MEVQIFINRGFILLTYRSSRLGGWRMHAISDGSKNKLQVVAVLCGISAYLTVISISQMDDAFVVQSHDARSMVDQLQRVSSFSSQIR